MRKHTVGGLSAALFMIAAGAAVAAEPAPTGAADAATAPRSATTLPASDHCLTQTGTHIAPKPGDCVPAASGQVISRDEIEKSGATSVGDAIHRLTPY